MASLLVLVGHVRHLLLVDYRYVANPGLGDRLLYFLTGLAPEAVVVFFVVSGFLVGGVAWDRWGGTTPRLGAYAAARISRIYTPLLPALVIGAAADLAGLRWFNAAQLYTNPMQYHTILLNDDFSRHLDGWTFLGNLAMLQSWLVPRLGSNGPLWSLPYEWWCYVEFALVAGALAGSPLRRSVCGALALALALVLPHRFFYWAAIWSLGILAYVWSRSNAWRPGMATAAVLFAGVVAWQRITHDLSGPVHRIDRDLVLALAYVLLLVGATRARWTLPGANWHESLTRFTYTTYLCHFPLMVLAVSIAYQVLGVGFQRQPDAAGVAWLLGLTALLWLACYGIAQVTERHTASVRRRLEAWLGLRAPRPA